MERFRNWASFIASPFPADTNFSHYVPGYDKTYEISGGGGKDRLLYSEQQLELALIIGL